MQEDCRNRAKTIQAENTASGNFNDINYNFLISRFGVIEGRGWDFKVQSRIDFSFANWMSIGILEQLMYQPGAALNETISKLVSDGKFLGKLDASANWTCQVVLCSNVN